MMADGRKYKARAVQWGSAWAGEARKRRERIQRKQCWGCCWLLLLEGGECCCHLPLLPTGCGPHRRAGSRSC